jgi:Arc/MetJ-type ribon-helix-helix transcriptional regulator
MSKGGKPQTQTNTINPVAMQAYQQNLDLARSTAQGLGPQQFAGFDPRYEAGEAALYEASMKPFGAEEISIFQNPFESEVVQQSLRDIEQSRQMAGLRDAQQATAAKAFGGSRAGVQSALTNEAAMREAARTASDLRYRGFNTAADLAKAARSINTQGFQNAMNLGLTRQQFAQLGLDAQRNLPLQRLAIQQAAVGTQPANLGGTTSQPTSRNVASGALGGALAGAQLGSIFPGVGNVVGAIGGGLLGGLFG